MWEDEAFHDFGSGAEERDWAPVFAVTDVFVGFREWYYV